MTVRMNEKKRRPKHLRGLECSGEIKQCLECPYDPDECVAVKAGIPVGVDEYARGNRVFEGYESSYQPVKNRRKT